MKHLALFNGIGGFQLSAHWAGFENVAHVEIDGWCNKVVAQHFTDSECFRDIHNVTVDNYGNLLYISGKNIITMGQPRSTKYNNAVSLYNSGLSIGECAEFYEISRQAMHKILQRRDCDFRSNKKYGADNHFHRGALPDNSKKKRANHLIEKAIQKGILTNPGVCEDCRDSGILKDKRNLVQGHHDDYDKPLEVRWLCQKCHHDWHKENKALNEYDIEKTNEPSAAIDIVSGGFP